MGLVLIILRPSIAVFEGASRSRSNDIFQSQASCSTSYKVSEIVLCRRLCSTVTIIFLVVEYFFLFHSRELADDDFDVMKTDRLLL